METALVVVLVLVALGLMSWNFRRNLKAVQEKRGPRLPWFVVVPLLVLIAVLFYLRFTT